MICLPMKHPSMCRMGDAPLVRVAVHHPLEGPLQPGAPLAGTLDFRAGREAAAGGAAPRCTEVRSCPLGRAACWDGAALH